MPEPESDVRDQVAAVVDAAKDFLVVMQLMQHGPATEAEHYCLLVRLYKLKSGVDSLLKSVGSWEDAKYPPELYAGVHTLWELFYVLVEPWDLNYYAPGKTSSSEFLEVVDDDILRHHANTRRDDYLISAYHLAMLTSGIGLLESLSDATLADRIFDGFLRAGIVLQDAKFILPESSKSSEPAGPTSEIISEGIVQSAKRRGRPVKGQEVEDRAMAFVVKFMSEENQPPTLAQIAAGIKCAERSLVKGRCPRLALFLETAREDKARGEDWRDKSDLP